MQAEQAPPAAGSTGKAPAAAQQHDNELQEHGSAPEKPEPVAVPAPARIPVSASAAAGPSMLPPLHGQGAFANHKAIIL